MHEAHRLGLVHRDVKPSNVMIEHAEDGTYKPYLMDFGIAREAGAAGRTATGAIAGTPSYMAPEQARGEVHALDRRTDVYSLGATLYDIVAGRPPFVAASAWGILKQILHDEAPPIRSLKRDVPADLEAIVARCLEKEPTRRYPSAKALAEDLQRFLDGDPVEAHRLTWRRALVRRARRHRGLVGLAGAALLGAMVSVGVSLRARRLAAEQAQLARELGEDVKEMELFLRSAYELPLHDVERERDVVRARLAGIEARMAAAGRAGEGPGRYALGRGYLALQEPEHALPELRAASAAGYASPELDYALGLTLGELATKAREKAKRIGDPTLRAARLEAIKAEYEAPALQHLHASLGTRLDAPAYVEGLIALYAGKPEEALAKAEEASKQAPWLYEPKELEADARFALGSRFRADAAFDYDRMMSHFRPAAEAYESAAEMARSDPRVHEAECELWAQSMNGAVAHQGKPRPGYEKARAACGRAIAASSRSEVAQLKLAFVQELLAWHLTIGSTDEDPAPVIEEAIAGAEEAMRRRPEEPMAPYVMGAAWRAESNYLERRGIDSRTATERAIASYEKAVSMDPTFLWALNELAAMYTLKARDETRRGLDPAPSLQISLEYIRRGSAIAAHSVPHSLGAYNATIFDHLSLAEYLVTVGRDPTAPLALARAATEEGRTVSKDWSDADFYVAYSCWIEANYALDAGLDPAAALDRSELPARRVPDATDFIEVSGKLGVTRALDRLRRGEDPEPALGAARQAFRRLTERLPWDLGYHVWRARVEIVALRWAAKERTLESPAFAASRAPLLPLLDQERVDPRLYQALAETSEIEATWLVGAGKNAEKAIASGLAMADKALSLNPHLARVLSTRGALLATRARAAREPERRAEAARGAEEALSSAARENPLLEREIEPLLREARAMGAKVVIAQ